MTQCQHSYHNHNHSCQQTACPDSTLCIWHDPSVLKSDPYVIEVLQQTIALISDDLIEFQLAGLQFPKAPWAGKCLNYADLSDANLQQANLSDAQLRGTRFHRSYLAGADLRGADLSHADLTGCNLSNATLSGANLQGVTLDNTILNGTDLRGADLSDAHIDSFSWNRLTRFAGVIGFEAETNSVTSDSATQKFVAPLALGQFDPLREQGHAPLDSSHPALRRTHVYKNLNQNELLAGIETPSMASIPSTHLNEIEKAHQLALHKQSRLTLVYKILTAAAVLLALSGWVLASSYQSNSDAAINLQALLLKERSKSDRLQAELSKLPTQVDTPALAADDSKWKRLIEEKNKALIAADNELKLSQQREQHIEDFRHQQEKNIADLQSKVDGLYIDNQRLNLRDDTFQNMRHKYNQAKQLAEDYRIKNQRLQRTASILAEGLDKVERERDELVVYKKQQLGKEFKNQDLVKSVDSLTRDKKSLEKFVTELESNNENLRIAGRNAIDKLDAFRQRIEGTSLQEILGEAQDTTNSIPIIPGKAIVLGGDYLVTLRVTPHDEDPDSIATRVVIQREAHDPIPDVNLILYDEQGSMLRRLSYSFSGGSASTSPFVSASSKISCQTFPASVRILLNTGTDNKGTATVVSKPTSNISGS